MSAPIIFDRALYAARRLRAGQTDNESFIIGQVCENLSERLGAMKRRFSLALDLTSRRQSSEFLRGHADSWIRTGLHPQTQSVSLVADEEALPFAAFSFDLVISVLGLHTVNDLPGALVQIRRALAPEGLFMAALFGGETLNQLRRALAAAEAEQSGGTSPRVAPFADVRDMGGLLQRAGFVSPVSDVELLSARYASCSTLFKDLRAIGETNALAQRRRMFLSRGVLSAALANYEKSDAPDGKFTASFDILYLTGWASDPAA
jgi:SAM-dependent methyltransferase